MLNSFISGAEHIYLACGATDFRKQIESLVALVTMRFHLDPYSPVCVFLFCNKNRTAIKVLRYDKNGFILANKKLLEGMKFQWPKSTEEVKDISIRQVEWLLEGLSIEQQKAHRDIKLELKDTCY
jgi:transposase